MSRDAVDSFQTEVQKHILDAAKHFNEFSPDMLCFRDQKNHPKLAFENDCNCAFPKAGVRLAS